ncbi:winged helix-turn-helix domain-containing protein [Ferruginibacter sp. SUN002]|uniref:winged helix-turn-helix domain-containing protein n=1 Tax=Ferruginibacter sp. SUN002 TaxID=2937789 RepID=UPI003D366327
MSLLVLISLICVAFGMVGNDEFDIARREVLLRRIGHEILLQSGDSVSRVLPVKKIAENEYQIRFENDLSFQPEFLVNTTQRLLAKDPLASDYVVNVVTCANDSVAYGYAISKNKKDDIIACIGRKQPTGCYMINIKFKPTGITTTKNKYLLGGLAFLGLVGFIVFRSVKQREALPEGSNTDVVASEVRHADVFTLGSMLFDTAARKLMINGNSIELTKTETRVLRIFALSPNEAIERSRLQKEIWEDEGVIVGRSLDMFISKLRKKLESDPNVNIAVIRGKGYKLEISA